MLHHKHGSDQCEKEMRTDADHQKFAAGAFPLPPSRQNTWPARPRPLLLNYGAHSSSFTVKVTLSILATARASRTSMVRLYLACSSLTMVTTAGVFAASAFCFNLINVAFNCGNSLLWAESNCSSFRLISPVSEMVIICSSTKSVLLDVAAVPGN